MLLMWKSVQRKRSQMWWFWPVQHLPTGPVSTQRWMSYVHLAKIRYPKRFVEGSNFLTIFLFSLKNICAVQAWFGSVFPPVLNWARDLNPSKWRHFASYSGRKVTPVPPSELAFVRRIFAMTNRRIVTKLAIRVIKPLLTLLLKSSVFSQRFIREWPSMFE